MEDVQSGVRDLLLYGPALLLALVNSFKGKYWFGLLFWLPPVVAIGAVRLAKPDSAWARRFYSREKMGEAMERFPDHAEGVELEPDARTAPPVGRWLGAFAIAISAAMAAKQGL